MNQDEQIANKYLCSIGEVVFEPDGNRTPDFLLNRITAIEVRRLNQNFKGKDKTNGLEVVSIPFSIKIQNILDQFPCNKTDNNYWLKLSWKRNIGSFKKIKENLVKAINDFESSGENFPKKYSLNDNVEIEIGAKASNTNKKYSIGIFRDNDSGGWLVDMYSTEINYCLVEKANKIKPHLERYPEWWLVLVDHICAIDNENKIDILKYINGVPEFNKVIVLNYKAEIVLKI